MPIYAYKCSSCGLSKDILRKISDDPLTLCPACGKETLAKQVTAAGFQLKGSGWYVTDFREGQKPATGTTPQATPDKVSSDVASGGAANNDTAATPAATPSATSAPAPSTPATTGASA